jgi:ubiquinone/menaquinone biosynthesis C-methylase UbiE
MLGMFESKNKKLVKKWKKDHENLVIIGQKVIAEYVKNNESEARRQLKKFVDLSMDHLTSEDIEFYKMLNDSEKKDPRTEELIEEFQRTFKDTKTTLMKFLAKYVRPETPLDDEFFDTFQKIMEILAKRIKFEEDNLYFRLSLS